MDNHPLMEDANHAKTLYDPLSQESRTDPYPAYERLRTRAPVYYCEPRNVWVLSRYEDVRAALRDWERFTSAKGLEIGDFVGFFGKGDFVQMDPPEHDDVRRIFAPRFANRAMSHYEPIVTTLAEQLVCEFPREGVVDIAEAFTQRLPLLTICQMLGIADSDVPWVVKSFIDMMKRNAGENMPSDHAHKLRSELVAFFNEQVELRINQDGFDDLLSDIAHAIQSGTIDRSHIPGVSLMLMHAGLETTSTLLGNIVHAIANKVIDSRELMDEQGELRNSALEEFLRFDAPIQWLSRVTTVDVTIHETTIPKGSRVLLLYASANRDPDVFPNPDVLDIGRESSRHLAFGEGIHFCLGMPLAKLETRIGIRSLLRKHRTITANGLPTRFPSLVGRGYDHLPVRLSPAEH